MELRNCANGSGDRQAGSVLIIVVVLGLSLLLLTLMSVQMSLVHSVTRSSQRLVFLADEIADSAAAQAIARVRAGGVETPMSGGGLTAVWVPFSEGSFYYYTTYDATLSASTIRAWGRVPADASPSSSTEAPDSASWDGSGWVVRGVEVTVRSLKFIPETPLYFGNGGIERPLGGVSWESGSDPSDPSTWVPITSSPTSYQASVVPFQVSALDHPQDYLYVGGAPAPASSNPHPYKVFASQNTIGQYNVEAWFTNSAGSGIDPTISVTPPPTSSYYDTSDSASPDYPYPVDPETPEVQSFAWSLWNSYSADPATVLLSSGSHSGVYGDLTSPQMMFVTGSLNVAAGTSFRGAGILVIRDDYDPNVDTNNTPSIRANLEISGQFEWTGLVIVAGWAPGIYVNSGGDATIVGAVFAEDSVQSGSEVSLDSATATLVVQDDLRVLYSNAIFQPGGLAYSYLPFVSKKIVAIRKL
jgi:hypothetical protein